MSFLNKVKSTFNQGRDALQKEVSKFRNKEFMEATLAACALIAYADGDVSSEEKQKMMGFVENSDELKNFDSTQIIETFSGFVGKMQFDIELGRAECLKVIGKVREKQDQARMVIRVAIAIANSDGNFDNAEKKVVRDIANDLGLDASEFDV